MSVELKNDNGYKSIILNGVNFSTGAYKAYKDVENDVKRLTVYVNLTNEDVKELTNIGVAGNGDNQLTIYDNSKSVKPGEEVQHFIILKFSKNTTVYEQNNHTKLITQFDEKKPNFKVDDANVAVSITKNNKGKGFIYRVSAYQFKQENASVFTNDYFGDDSEYTEIQEPQQSQDLLTDNGIPF